MKQRLLILLSGSLLSLLSLSFAPVPRSYLEAVVDLNGTDYWKLNCSEYICAAKHHPNCSAESFWQDGCGGDLAVVQDVTSFGAVDTSKLIPGDIVAFHGVHVGVFVGNGIWMDSDFKHGGVGIMQPNKRRGGWFWGEVKILRWKK
jgi:hypothetical protein